MSTLLIVFAVVTVVITLGFCYLKHRPEQSSSGDLERAPAYAGGGGYYAGGRPPPQVVYVPQQPYPPPQYALRPPRYAYR